MYRVPTGRLYMVLLALWVVQNVHTDLGVLAELEVDSDGVDTALDESI